MLVRVAALVLLTAFRSCATDDAAGPGRDLDAGTPPPATGDASIVDAAAPSADAGQDEDLDGIPAGPGLPRAGEDGRHAASCYDGLDNDDSGVLDCDDGRCRTLASCCVGHGDCCAPMDTPPLPSRITFEGCESLAACLGGVPARTFGDPAPTVADGHFAGGGDEDGDSGLLFDAPLDLQTHRLVLQTRFTSAEACGATCLESAGVGLTTEAQLDASATVDTIVALVASGAQARVLFLVGGNVAGSFPASDAAQDWQLVVRPTGEVTVEQPGGAHPLARARITLPRTARLVLFGRSRNPAAEQPQGAGLAYVESHVEACDAPGSWSARAPITLRHAGASVDVPSGASAPSLLSTATRRALAFAHGGAIHLALGDGEDATSFLLTTPMDAPPLRARPGTFDAGGISDPELLADTGVTHVFHTAYDDEHVARIGLAQWHADGRVVQMDAPLVRPEDLGYDHLEAPTVLHHRNEFILIARARDADGQRLVLLRAPAPGGPWRSMTGSDLAARSAASALDVDEIGDPTLTVRAGAYRLHVARRRGTRWSVGLLVSDELLAWRALPADVLPAGSGFDRLAVRGADAAESATESVLHVAYVGHDGMRGTLAIATRPVTGGAELP